MIAKELFDPKSIVIVGGSNDVEKPGGKILKNIIKGGFKGEVFVVNPKAEYVQGKPSYKSVEDIEQADLAILAIPAKYCLDTVKTLAEKKSTKGFIVLSAGFSEFGEEGQKLEQKIVDIANKNDASLVGPNCIGICNQNYKGVFAGIIPRLDPNGCDIVSGSGATIAFILELAVPRGLSFNNIISVGNSAQIGVEEVLEHWDETFDPKTSSKVKLLYLEQIKNPNKFYKHARSLINKGCRIAAIKAGRTEAGNRAVSSHTGALAGSDASVEALFKKAGIVRCYSRVELVYTGGVLMHRQLTGNNIAVITHAGGSGVMLTDTLTDEGMNVPPIEGPAAEELLSKLHTGSSVANPIDFLATGNADQLGTILEYVDREFDNIDGSVVIFGTTGMFDVTGVYDVLHEKMKWSKKPIYPCLPSVVQADKAVNHFLSLGRVDFTDEVTLGRALSKVYNTPKPAESPQMPEIDKDTIRYVIKNAENGYLDPDNVDKLLDAAGIPRIKEEVVHTREDAANAAKTIGFPVAMKVVGPLHKTDVGGVTLNLRHEEVIAKEFDKMMKIEGAKGVLLQPMHDGTEIFIGAKHEPKYGHVVLFGLGGIFIEVFKDVVSGLAPIGKQEAKAMFKKLRSYKLIEGFRKKEGVNEDIWAEIILRLSALLKAAPEIAELDLNPLMGRKDSIVTVDGRIRIDHDIDHFSIVD